MRRRVFLGSTAAVAAALAAAPARAAFSQELVIAVNAPLSGDLRDAGQQLAAGVRGAIDEANRFAGIMDRVFAMRTFDDMGALASAMTNVDFASGDPSIVATVGGIEAATTIATLPQYANQQMPLLVAGSTADAITGRGYRNVWRLPTKDSIEGMLFARYLADEKLAKHGIAIAQDGDYGYDVAQGFAAQMKSRKLDGDVYVFPIEKPDYARAAKEILTRSADFLLLCGRTSDMGPLVPALRAAGFTGRFGASEGFYNSAALRYAGALGGDFRASTSMPPLDRAPTVFTQLADLRAAYGNVTTLMAFGYAAAQIVIAACKRTGVTSRSALMSALQFGNSYQTLVGSYTFTPTGDPLDPNLYFYRIVDGAFKFDRPSHAGAFVL